MCSSCILLLHYIVEHSIIYMKPYKDITSVLGVKKMIVQWICNKLIQKRDKERHDVMKLEWQKAELERKIANAKREREICITEK